jgi:hypothetical protein
MSKFYKGALLSMACLPLLQLLGATCRNAFLVAGAHHAPLDGPEPDCFQTDSASGVLCFLQTVYWCRLHSIDHAATCMPSRGPSRALITEWQRGLPDEFCPRSSAPFVPAHTGIMASLSRGERKFAGTWLTSPLNRPWQVGGGGL